MSCVTPKKRLSAIKISWRGITLSVAGLAAGALVGGLTLGPGRGIADDSMPAQYGPLVPQNNSGSAPAAVMRTSADRARDASFSATRSPAGNINAPTIPMAQYLSLQAAASKAASRPAGSAHTATGPNASVRGVNFQAAVEGENGQFFVPPDVDGSIGSTQFVQTTNSSIDVWSKVTTGTPAHLLTVSQNSFTGNSTDALGDGSVLYDWVWNRWVILLDDFSNLSNSGKPEFYLAISTTSNATGSYFIYPVAMNTSTPGLFFDFPKLGMDQDAILITGNWFNGNSFVSPSAFSIAKARVYNGDGFGFSFGFPGSSVGTLVPPLVPPADQSPFDYFIAAPVGSGVTNVLMFTMRYSGRAAVLAGPANLPVNSYITPPPLGQQTCSSGNAANQLDTLDGRFQNRSLQINGYIWNVHTVNAFGGFPTADWYEFNATNLTARQQGLIFLSGSSDDFNPHISSAGPDQAAMTWTATDPSVGKDAMMIIAGRQKTDALGSMTLNSTPLVTSPSCMTGSFDPNFGHQRWGDYAVVSPDFSGINTNGFYWTGNEFTLSGGNDWATEFARIANP